MDERYILKISNSKMTISRHSRECDPTPTSLEIAEEQQSFCFVMHDFYVFSIR
jgi:hypothetical protein